MNTEDRKQQVVTLFLKQQGYAGYFLLPSHLYFILFYLSAFVFLLSFLSSSWGGKIADWKLERAGLCAGVWVRPRRGAVWAHDWLGKQIKRAAAEEHKKRN
jgi:hypothetical protein